MGKYTDWLGSHRNVKLLQAASALRSVCQGIALVDISLYFNGLGWNGGQIGALFAASALFRILITSFAEELNGLLGVRRYMIAFELLTALCAAAMAITANMYVLFAAVVLSGFGRGHTGSGGPITPVERAWLSAYAKKNTERIFGVHSVVGYAGLAIGCLIGGLPTLWRSALSVEAAYWPMFALMGLASLGCAFLVYKVTGGERRSRPKGEQGGGAPARGHAGIISTINNVAVMLAGTMTAYWLTARFGASAGSVGVMMALAYFAAGAVSLIGMRLSGKFGSVRSAAGMQLAGVAIVAVLPWVSAFWPAALLSAASTALNLGTRGNRNALLTDNRNRHRRTLMSRIHALIARMAIVLWPGAFGRMIDQGHWVLPFYIAAAIQLAATLLFAAAHRKDGEPQGKELAV